MFLEIKKSLISTIFMTFVLIIGILSGVALDLYGAENDNPVLKYERVLNRCVTSDGMVNYKEVKYDSEFLDFIKYLEETDPNSLPTDNDRLAFWINAYNAFVILGVIEEYPIDSVLKVGTIPHSFFILKKFKTKNGKITLKTLENEMIRDAFDEPLIHFAINCASIGCPKLISVAYSGENLDQQLEERAKAFINNKAKNYLDKEKRILYLSRIFKWYKGDFIKKHKKLEDYVATYLNKEDADFVKENKIKLEYLEYDWNLNDTDN